MGDEEAQTAQALPLNQQPIQNNTDRNDSTRKTQITITDLNRPISRLSASIALLLQIAIIAILIIFNLVPIWIQKPQSGQTNFFSISSTDGLLYLTGTTILATIVTSFTIGQIRSLWFSLAVSGTDLSESRETLGRARTLIGLASFREQFRNSFSTASFWIAGLVTTATVAGISATYSPLVTGTIAQLALDHTGIIPAVGVQPTCLNVLNSTEYAQSAFTWPLGNGSYIGLNTAYLPNCETQMVYPAILNARYTPHGYAYWMGGVPVAPLAAGVPYSIDQGFDYSFGLDGNEYGGQYGIVYASSSSQFNWVTQCFPVLAKNPVNCRRAGTVSVNGSAIFITTDGGCEVERSFAYFNTTTDPVMAAGICIDNSSSVGSSTIVIGATLDYVDDLSTSLNISYLYRPDTMAATCSVDIASSLGFRLLNFSRNPPQANYDEGSDDTPGQDFATHITVAANSCTPLSPQGPVNISQFLTPSMLATGGSASWQLLAEDTGPTADGYLATLMNTATNIQPTIGQTFPDSQNYLEDVLGQASAIALGLFWGYWQIFEVGGPVLEGLDPVNPDNIEVFIMNGNVSIEGVRAGSGSRIALLYIIPEVFCAGLLIWLLYSTRHLK